MKCCYEEILVLSICLISLIKGFSSFELQNLSVNSERSYHNIKCPNEFSPGVLNAFRETRVTNSKITKNVSVGTN